MKFSYVFNKLNPHFNCSNDNYKIGLSYLTLKIKLLFYELNCIAENDDV